MPRSDSWILEAEFLSLEQTFLMILYLILKEKMLLDKMASKDKAHWKSAALNKSL